MQIEITVYDACGSVLTHDVVEAQTATQEQIDEMVAMIDGGCPAWLAAQLVCPHTAADQS